MNSRKEEEAGTDPDFVVTVTEWVWAAYLYLAPSDRTRQKGKKLATDVLRLRALLPHRDHAIEVLYVSAG